MDREELKRLILENITQQCELQRKITSDVVANAEEKPDRWSKETASKAKIELLRQETSAVLDSDGERALLEIDDRKSVIKHRANVEVLFSRQADATERWATALERIATALEKAAEAT